MKHILSLSGGKDSTAMLLRILELRETEPNAYPLDEVVNVDTGMEFPQMYEHLEKLKKLVESKGIKYTTLKSNKSFEYLMCEHEYIGKDGILHKGYGWSSPMYRWCTQELKLRVQKKHGNNAQWYIGLAFDEEKRIQRQHNQNHLHPLVDWGWTEQMCLQYCYEKGYDWGGLYEMFHRVSCWCCPLKSIKELQKLYTHFPSLWQKMKDMDSKVRNDFRIDYTLEQLDIRFSYDKEIGDNSISQKDYYEELYKRFKAAGCPKKPRGFNADLKKHRVECKTKSV